MLHAELTHRLRTFALDVKLDVEAGRALALVGPSGAGKTTVLRAIAGLVRTDAGTVSCAGERWADSVDGTWVAPERRRCGVVFQDYALFPHLSAWRNVAYGLRGRDRRPRAVAALARFGAEALADARPRELSGGERQRVALARALAPEPRVLLLDEPLAALDPRTHAAATRELSALLHGAGIPTIVVTHAFSEACALADEIVVIDDGVIVQRGTPRALVDAPASGFVAHLTGAGVLRGVAHPERGAGAVALDGGGELWAPVAAPAAGPLLALIRPWEVSLAAPEAGSPNRVPATVTAVTPLGGGRMRVTLGLPQTLIVEVGERAWADLGAVPGAHVSAVLDSASIVLISG